MTRCFFLFVVLCIHSASLFAQQDQLFSFKINGKIDADTGTVELWLVADTSFYPKSLRNLRAKVENKKFVFEGYLPSPQGFELLYGANYHSTLFIVQPGIQTINVTLDSNRRTPQVLSGIMQVEHNEFKKAFRQVRHERVLLDKKWDSLLVVYNDKLPNDILVNLRTELKKSYHNSDKVLLDYASTHSNSYVAFWNLVELLRFGYEPIFDSIFHHLSDSIKSSYAGKNYAKMIKLAGVLSVDKVFPSMPIKDNEEKEFNISSMVRSKYTLVDFWYSNCAPCLAKFPDLRKTYQKYKDQGLEIIGVSTDKGRDKDEWERAITKHQLVWPQYWDKDGREASKLSIVAFPTNFLLDRNGKILKRNLTPAELEQFFIENK